MKSKRLDTTQGNSGVKMLKTYSQPIAEMVAVILDEVRASLPEVSPHGAWALETLREYSLRDSKRVRGSLAAAMYDHVLGGTRDQVGLRLAAAIELIQNHLLIVDDVMDRSVLRRGQPTVHELYKSTYRDDAHEANSIGVLVGMMAQLASMQAMTTLDTDARRIVATMHIVQRHTLITDIGQIDDVQQAFGRTFTRDDLLRKYQQKSSYYSFVDPLLAALTLAGAGDGQAEIDCERYGLPAGVAFQLRDDYLGLFGDTSQTGKPNLDDICEGKHTLMVDFALEHASAQERDVLAGVLGRADADEHDLARVQDVITSSGAVAQADDMMRRMADEAVAAARTASSWDASFGNMLAELVLFAVTREK